MDFWQQYRAIDSRDARFDGQFVTAVRSTGIYCRPSCPARTPKPGNVVFYRTSAAAHDAGYRACKRCLPEAVPGTPEWNIRSDVAGRAMRLISDGVVDREGVSGLAGRLGYSTRQLNRILGHELGAGPLALSRAVRAQTARTLLTATSMKLADVAFASGFGSIRQFNDSMTEIFDSTPGALRERARQPANLRTPHKSAALPGQKLVLKLPFRPPYDPGIFAFLAARAVSGVELAATANNAYSYSRTLLLPHGHGQFEAQFEPERGGPGSFTAGVTVEDLRDLPSLLTRLRRLFDLDADPAAVDDVLSEDGLLARRVAEIPGIRLPGAVDANEILVRAMIGQQVSVAAATSTLNALAALGTESRLPAPGLSRLFPGAGELADSAAEIMRGPARRIASFCAVTALLAAGSLKLDVGDSPDELAAKLLPVAGIGPWTVGYVSMRVLGAPDVSLANDAAVRKGLRLLDAGTPAANGAAYLERFRPWRSYATMHLWRAAANIRRPRTQSEVLGPTSKDPRQEKTTP